VDRQVSGHPAPVIRDDFHGPAREFDRGIVPLVEKIAGQKMLIPLPDPGSYASDGYFHVYRCTGPVGRVELNRTRHFRELSPDMREGHVPDRKSGTGVVWIDYPCSHVVPSSRRAFESIIPVYSLACGRCRLQGKLRIMLFSIANSAAGDL
jgi:hypothetical protein